MPGRRACAQRRGQQDFAVALPFDAVETDDRAEAAERYFAQVYGLPWRGATRPDEGDFFPEGDRRTFILDVKWTPRDTGRLVVYMRSRVKADIYVLVVGRDWLRIAGWAWGFVVRQHVVDLGYGPCYAMTQEQLQPSVDILMATFGYVRRDR